MDALGGQINAYTTKEYTCYHTRVLDKHIDRALDVMSDMLLHPLIAQEEVQKERNVITEEIYMYDDAPEELVHDALQDAIWRDTSLGMPIWDGGKQLLPLMRISFGRIMNGIIIRKISCFLWQEISRRRK